MEAGHSSPGCASVTCGWLTIASSDSPHHVAPHGPQHEHGSLQQSPPPGQTPPSPVGAADVTDASAVFFLSLSLQIHPLLQHFDMSTMFRPFCELYLTLSSAFQLPLTENLQHFTTNGTQD